MAGRKPFLLRLDPALFEALQRWANDDVRSLNGQIEFLLTRALREAGRLREARTAESRAAKAGRHEHDSASAEPGRRERSDKSSKP